MNDERLPALRRRVEALSQDQRQSLAESLAREVGPQSTERLVGFVVVDRDSPPSDETLRTFLADRLPDYMIPARFVALERLPRTAAGKLDRQALAREHRTEQDANAPERLPSAPSTELEARLIAIWQAVLKADGVGLDDDFFEIGGDSLLSIRVIARAGREGIRISPERFFERPTVRHMAAAIAAGLSASANGRTASVDGVPLPDAVGEAPLTPIQHWFLDAIPEQRDWWNQSVLLELAHPLDAARLREIVCLLVEHHDALRLRLVHRDGQWQQHFPPPNADAPFVDDRLSSRANPSASEGDEGSSWRHPWPEFRAVAIDGTPDELATRVAEECDREHASLRLDEGKLFRCILFEGQAGWRRLLLLGHHLVVDGVSWTVILEDLATLVAQAAAGEPLRLPAKSASARAWAIGLAARAATVPAATANHWLAMPADGGAMPVDTTNTSSTNRDAEVVTLILRPDESRRLLHDAPRLLDATVQSLLLAALLLAWRRWSGSDVLRLDLEGLGRDVLGGATIDVSRTVGWFTTVFPVRLAIPREAPGGEEPPTPAVVKAVQEVLDALPMRGAAHGLLRHLAPNESTRATLAARPRPALLFNHLGAHDVTLLPASRLRVTEEPSGRARSPDAARPYLLELNSRVQNGALIVTIEYARGVHHAATVERFASLLREALATVAQAVPARFGTAGFDAAVLATVSDLLEEVDEQDESDDP